MRFFPCRVLAFELLAPTGGEISYSIGAFSDKQAGASVLIRTGNLFDVIFLTASLGDILNSRVTGSDDKVHARMGKSSTELD